MAADDNPSGARLEAQSTATDGTRLAHWEQLPQAGIDPRAMVLIVHGYGDHSGRYDEVARSLLARGYGVASFDLRGHGRSGGQRGYVRTFRDYLSDLQQVAVWVRARHRERPLALLGHSTGGLIAIRALQERYFEASALVAVCPLLRIADEHRVVPDWVARLISVALPRLPLPSGIDAEELTHDPAWVKRTREDTLCHGKATPRWFWEAQRSGRVALQAAGRLQLPVLVVKADQDTLSDPATIGDFFARLGSADRTLLERKGEYHEVLNETDRQAVFAILGDWLDARLSRQTG